MVELDLTVSSEESDAGASGESEQSTPPRPLTPQIPSSRSQTIEISVTVLPHVCVPAVMVETAADESSYAMRHSRRALTLEQASDSYHPDTDSSHVDTHPNCSCRPQSEPEALSDITRGTDIEDEAVIVAELLVGNGNAHGSLARSHSRNDSVSVERAICSHGTTYQRCFRFKL